MHVGTRKNWHNKFITLSVLLNKHWHAIKFTMSHLICPRGNMRTQRTLYYVFHKLTLVKGALHNWPRRTQHCSLCACTTLTLLAEQVFETCRVRACKAVHIVRQKFGSVCDVLSCDDIERCRLSSSGTCQGGGRGKRRSQRPRQGGSRCKNTITSMGPVEVPADTVCYTVSVHCSINECIHHVSIVLSMYLMSQCVRVRVYVYKYVCLCVYHRIYA